MSVKDYHIVSKWNKLLNLDSHTRVCRRVRCLCRSPCFICYKKLFVLGQIPP